MQFPTTMLLIVFILIGSLFVNKNYMVITNKICDSNGCVYEAHLITNPDQTLRWKTQDDCFEIDQEVEYNWIKNKITETCN